MPPKQVKISQAPASPPGTRANRVFRGKLRPREKTSAQEAGGGPAAALAGSAKLCVAAVLQAWFGHRSLKPGPGPQAWIP